MMPCISHSSWKSRESDSWPSEQGRGREREGGGGGAVSFTLIVLFLAGRGGPGGDTQGYKLILKVLSPARVLGLQRRGRAERRRGWRREGRRAWRQRRR